MALILLRHNAPEVEPGICYGRSDIAARSVDDARLAKLIASLPRPISDIHTSPLARCATLADQIGMVLGLDVRREPRLLELDFGKWEMRAWDQIPRHEIDLWAADVRGARPHDGETVREMTHRVRAYLEDYANAKGNILCVTHLGVVRCANAALGQTNAFELMLGYGEFLAIEPKVGR
ncbi:histidine phosphatase family protein [Parasphingopyxis sp.]|uniref:histidine phosphatase family protein n=1 Tax=Parasphingopyxis sp. TaxID=1920299 RepID=UPI002623D0D8|nr:histidine phosphatase family protein [Parasphingopyxis sp.]